MAGNRNTSTSIPPFSLLFILAVWSGCGNVYFSGDAASREIIEDIHVDEADQQEPGTEDVLPDEPDPDVPEEASITTWARTCGGLGFDYLRSIQITSDGGFIAAGDTYSFGGGTSNYWVVKLDAGGGVIWERTYGGDGDDYANHVSQTSDGGYIVAGGSSTFSEPWTGDSCNAVLVFKLDSFGNIEWQKAYDAEESYRSDKAYFLLQTSDDGYLIAAGTTRLGSMPPDDLLLMKTDTYGNLLWHQAFSAWVSKGISIHQTPDSGYLVMTMSSGILRLDANGSLLWRKTVTGYAGEVTDDGGFAVLGSSDRDTTDPSDLVVSRLDANGDFVWKKRYEMDCSVKGISIHCTPDAGFIVTGYTETSDEGAGDALLLKVDQDGRAQWLKLIGGFNEERGYWAQAHEDGGYVMAGYTRSFGAGYADFWLLKTDDNGDIAGDCPDQMVRGVEVEVVDIESSTWARDIEIVPLDLTSFQPDLAAEDTHSTSHQQCGG